MTLFVFVSRALLAEHARAIRGPVIVWPIAHIQIRSVA